MKKTGSKNSGGKKVVHLWHFICMGVGVLACLVSLFMWMGYLTAGHKFKAEATLMDISITEKERPLKKDDVRYSPSNKYETYYKYKLTWRFENPESEQKHSFISEDEASHRNAHDFGEKKTVFIYYSGDESDFEFMDPFVSMIVLLAGAAIFIFPIVDIIRGYIHKKKIEKRDAASMKQRQ